MDILEMLESAVFDGCIECPECGERLEPDAERCSCGCENTLRGMGMI